MELYTRTSYQLSRDLTLQYSTSFGKSSKLFSRDIQPHIYAIYGLVRIADEIVDTYQGSDAGALLDALETETHAAIKRGYSTNPIVHSFALTAAQYGITESLTRPFFDSMRLDLTPQTYTQMLYEAYIYGSAEVIGLMCLKVFVEGDQKRYHELEAGARALGSAYQKVNFLRDIASDFADRERVYFPGLTFDAFNDDNKKAITQDIAADFDTAAPTIAKLPVSARKAVALSFAYYKELLSRLEATPATTLKTTRVRVPNHAKVALLIKQKLSKGKK